MLALAWCVLGLAFAAPALADSPGTLSIIAGTGSSGAPTPGPATNSELYNPFGVAVDSNTGDVYIADQVNNEVERVTPSGTLSIIAGNGNTGAPTPGPATSSDLYAPSGVAVDSSTGDLYIADTLNSKIERVTPSGTLSIIAGNGNTGAATPGPATSSKLHNPSGVAVDPSTGDVYIADQYNNEVERVTPSGTLSIVAGTGTGGAATPGPATSSELDAPTGVAVDPSTGDLYIADQVNSEIERVTPSGTLSIIAGTGTSGAPTPGPATNSELYRPYGVAVDPSTGNLYIADYANSEIEQVTPSGTLSIIAGTGAAGAAIPGPATGSDLYYAAGVAVDPGPGDLYIADTYDNEIEQVVPAAPVNTAAPVVSGTPQVGQTLSVSDGAWSNSPAGYSYQWQDCDSNSANCTNIAGATGQTYALTAGDVGDTVRVLVIAANGGGSVTQASLMTAVITAVTVSVPGPVMPSPAATSPVATTTVPVTGADAVSLTSGALSAGVEANVAGQVSLPLSCPTVSAGVCLASGTLSLSTNPVAPRSSDAILAHVINPETVIARFAGVQIQAGQQQLVATQLSPQAIAYLRDHGIYRIRVTLALRTTLTDGQSISSTQQVWLYVPGLTGCHAATGSLTAAGIGSLRLGSTHQGAHRTGSYRRGRYGFEKYCVAGGNIRVAYSSRAIARADHTPQGRVVLVLTGNQHYQARGIRSNTTIKTVRAHTRLGQPLHVGKNAWYFIPAPHFTYVIKAQNGVVREIGVATHASAHTRTQDRYLLHHLK